MQTLTTKGISISVEADYRSEHSSPSRNQFIFSYQVTIRNNSKFTVQLLRRHWKITDAHGQIREVEGAGVIGLQPVLEPGDSHSYTSWCPLTTEIGRMTGTYLMHSKSDDSEFKVAIPEFEMCADFKVN